MKTGHVVATLGGDWCLIEFEDETAGKVYMKLQGNEESIPWELGTEMVLLTKDEMLEKMAMSYDQGFHACEEAHCL